MSTHWGPKLAVATAAAATAERAEHAREPERRTKRESKLSAHKRAQLCIHQKTHCDESLACMHTEGGSAACLHQQTHCAESLACIHKQTHRAEDRERRRESAAYTAKVERLQTKLSARLASASAHLFFGCMLQWMTGRRSWCWRRCVFAAVDASSAVSVLLNWPAARAPASLLSPSHAHTHTSELVLLLFSFRFSFGVLLLNEAEPLLLPLRSGFYCASS